MDMLSIGRNLEAVAGVRDPLFQPGDQPLAFRAVSVVLRLVGLFERIVIQIEEKPGAALEADVFPAVARHDSAVWRIDAVGMPRGDHVLQVRGIRLRSRGRAVLSVMREIGALHPGRLLDAAEAQRGGRDVYMIGDDGQASVSAVSRQSTRDRERSPDRLLERTGLA